MPKSPEQIERGALEAAARGPPKAFVRGPPESNKNNIVIVIVKLH